jgi:hypothetical protein
MPAFRFILAFVLLLAAEVLRVYFIMPFPGSQQVETISIAYWLDRNIGWLRLVLLTLAVWTALPLWRKGSLLPKIVLGLCLALFATVFYFFNFRFLADRMFLPPGRLDFKSRNDSPVNLEQLVIGIESDGLAKAYPIQLIGYHHQVRDSIGGQPVMVTYCTVCRTGRVFSPLVDGSPEDFRLVGMDHFNAMFEDGTTRSWWRQATGEAVAGPRKGRRLTELPSRQMSLAAWLRLHPHSLMMQSDTAFRKRYDDLAGFDNGTIESDLERRDSGSWQPKSWVVGILSNGHAKAYDWNRLAAERIIHDSIPGMPLLIVLESDGQSFHAWDRRVNGRSMSFVASDDGFFLSDVETRSVWDMNGLCLLGSLKGSQLEAARAYQEFWHSWQTFHPNTMR